MIEIDGSKGGGQLLRSSLSLSAITKKPFKITNIRGMREKGGLQHQHLTAVNAIAEICNAKVKGNTLHSRELEFIPGDVKGGYYRFDIGTAGSTTLVLQTILPALLREERESTIEVKGGTANPMAVPIYDFRHVFLWYLKMLGINTMLSVVRHGFYPAGGGKIILNVKPCAKLNELNLIERKELDKICIYSVASKSLEKNKVAERLIDGFKKYFKDNNESLETKISYVDTLSPGCFICAVADYGNSRLGYTALGKLGVKAEDIGKECTYGLLDEIKSNATVDHFTADQLLLYIALANGGSFTTSRITNHIKTNIEIIEKFIDVKFEIKENRIYCMGK
ncbi:MAG: RNA 3'-terminal phosphate cyclase [Nanoarchaeota archaeon]